MNNDGADGHCFGFKDLGHSVIHSFLLLDYFRYGFSMLSEKKKENLSSRSLKFLQNAPLNLVLFSSLFICVAVSYAS